MDSENNYDIAIIGGGINGAGIAYDAAGRGLKVFLCEQNDFASCTSSYSSKLIHGGIRYLEHYEFRLVREALHEREVLLTNAPHLVKPLRFVMPHKPHLRPTWMMRAGLFLYDHLTLLRRLGKSRVIDLNKEQQFNQNLILEDPHGYEYADCFVDDSRLVVENLLSARELGATVVNQTCCVQAQLIDQQWHLTLEDKKTQTLNKIKAKALVNATGPWAQQFLQQTCQQSSPYHLRLVRGSHIVTHRLHQDSRALLIQNEDKRVVFVIPWLDQYSLIGTTDAEQESMDQVSISEAERNYLISIINQNFKNKISQKDIVFEFAGVRPLCDDEQGNPSSVTRDYTIALSEGLTAPLLTVFGGKLTTYRCLAESALEKLKPFFANLPPAWTATQPLGGAKGITDMNLFYQQAYEKYSNLPQKLIKRLADAYGVRITQVLGNAQTLHELGQCLIDDLYEIEAKYLIEHEWAKQPRDILWRRTKKSVGAKADDENRVATWMQAYFIERGKT